MIVPYKINQINYIRLTFRRSHRVKTEGRLVIPVYAFILRKIHINCVQYIRIYYLYIFTIYQRHEQELCTESS